MGQTPTADFSHFPVQHTVAMEEPRFVKRKVIAGELKADVTNRALIVEYQVEAAVLNEVGDVIQVETRPNRKVIHLKKLDGNSNVEVLAQGIIDRCELIHPSRLPALIGLLSDMQMHVVEEEGKTADPSPPPVEEKRVVKKKAHTIATNSTDTKPSRVGTAGTTASRDSGSYVQTSAPKIKANIDKLDDYMEKLYDDSVDERVSGAAHILQLARDPALLPHILGNETLMNALSRTAKDDYRKNMEVAATILRIFQCASQFDVFHEVLAQYSVGDLNLRILDYQHTRHKFRLEELDKLTQLADAQAKGDKDLEARIRRSVAEFNAAAKAKEKAAAKEKKKDSGSGTGSKKERRDKKLDEDEDGGGKEVDANVGTKGKKSGSKKTSSKSDRKMADDDDEEDKAVRLPEGIVDLETVTKKFKAFMKKQDNLLLVSVMILRNLAENIDTERKMTKRKLVSFLVPLLHRENEELVIAVAEFLRKLVLNPENLQAIATEGLIKIALPVTETTSEAGQKEILRLLFNLSFDRSMAREMATPVFMSSLVDKLKKTQFRQVSLKLLYHISQDRECRAPLIETEAVQLTLRLIHGFPQNTLSPELIGFAINMFRYEECVRTFCTPEVMNMLVHRLLKTRDSLLGKLLHNISNVTRIQTEDEAPDNPNPQKGVWSPFVKDLYKLARLAVESPDLLVEVLGVLSNIGASELPRTVTFPDLIKENEMLQVCQRLLVPGIAEDDVVLQVVMLLSVWLSDSATLPMFNAFARLSALLVDVLTDKSEDAELVLQTMVALEILIQNPQFINVIVYDTQAVARFCDLMTHACADIRSCAQHCLDIAIDHDRYVGNRGLWRQIQLRRYQLYNREYMAFLATSNMGAMPRTYSNNHPTSLACSDDEDGKWRDDGYGDSEEDSYNDLSRWQPGSPNAIRAHGERVAMSPMDFSTNYAGGGAGGGYIPNGNSHHYSNNSSALLYGDEAMTHSPAEIQPRRRY